MNPLRLTHDFAVKAPTALFYEIQNHSETKIRRD